MKFEIYQDRKKEWRWRLKSKNGRILAMSSEGYKRKAYASKVISNIKTSVFIAEVKNV